MPKKIKAPSKNWVRNAAKKEGDSEVGAGPIDPRKAAEAKLLGSITALTHPNFYALTTEERLMRVVLMAYLKHSNHSKGQEIGWDLLNDAAYNEIANYFGDDVYIAWSERMQ